MARSSTPVNFMKRQRLPLTFLVAFDLSVVIHTSLITRLLILSFILFMPGLVLMGKLRTQNIIFWQKAGLALCLSLLYLMLTGLVADLLLPIIFHITDPLATPYSLLFINATFLLLLGFNASHPWRSTHHSLRLCSTNRLSIIFYGLLFFFFLTSVCGALILNNGGSDLIAVCAQISLLALLVLSLIFRKQIAPQAYPLLLFFIALGLLYSFSLRGGMYVLGWDINQEYRTYLTTASSSHWLIGGLNHDPYNACLSLTILPTILHNLTSIDGQLIFKIIFPFFFAFLPVTVFLIVRRFTQPFIAFLATILMISQIEFTNEFPALGRQEVALLFIATFILLIVSTQIEVQTRKILLFCLIAGCTLSHYSTAYTILIILLLTYLLERVADKFMSRRIGNSTTIGRSILSGSMVCFAILTVFIWNLQVTQSSQNIGSALSGSILNINSIFNNSSRSDEASSALGITQSSITQQDVDEYVKQSSQSTKNETSQLYSNSDQFSTELLEPVTIAPKKIVSALAPEASDAFEGADLLVKASLAIGLLVLFYRYSQFYDQEDVKMISLLSIAAAIGLIIFAAVPYLSIAYGFGRFFFQTLIILSVPLVLGLEWLAKKMGSFALPVMCLVVFLYFNITLGIQTQLFGGTPSITLNNSGLKYNFYTHNGEVDGIAWLADQQSHQTIYADIYSYLKIESMSSIDLARVNTTVLPSTITKSSYVYARQTNLQGQGALRDYNFFHQASVDYNFPLAFLGTDKNAIYANQDSIIYR